LDSPVTSCFTDSITAITHRVGITQHAYFCTNKKGFLRTRRFSVELGEMEKEIKHYYYIKFSIPFSLVTSKSRLGKFAA
jgi:hypothetical protein